jgi:hypothetical protein
LPHLSAPGCARPVLKKLGADGSKAYLEQNRRKTAFVPAFPPQLIQAILLALRFIPSEAHLQHHSMRIAIPLRLRGQFLCQAVKTQHHPFVFTINLSLC